MCIRDSEKNHKGQQDAWARAWNDRNEQPDPDAANKLRVHLGNLPRVLERLCASDSFIFSAAHVASLEQRAD